MTSRITKTSDSFALIWLPWLSVSPKNLYSMLMCRKYFSFVSSHCPCTLSVRAACGLSQDAVWTPHAASSVSRLMSLKFLLRGIARIGHHQEGVGLAYVLLHRQFCLQCKVFSLVVVSCSTSPPPSSSSTCPFSCLIPSLLLLQPPDPSAMSLHSSLQA